MRYRQKYWTVEPIWDWTVWLLVLEHWVRGRLARREAVGKPSARGPGGDGQATMSPFLTRRVRARELAVLLK